MSHAVVPANGTPRSLDGSSQPNEVITPKDVADPMRVVRLFQKLLASFSGLLRLWQPRIIDFQDRTFLGDGTTVYRLEHKFGAKVNLWAIRWDSGGAGSFIYSFVQGDDLNTSAFVTFVAGKGTIRIEEAG